MDFIIKAVILGIIEGITEFLPIRSTGHLILANPFIQFTGDLANLFDVVIQLGAILSVVIYFWRRLYPFSADKTPEEKTRTWTIWKLTLAATVPALFIGGLLGHKVEEMLFNPTVVAWALLVGGALLWWLETGIRRPIIATVEEMPYRIAVAIGFIQCLAMIPGTSRSAASIIGAIALGLSRPAAAEFSFFLAVPTLAAASAYSLLKTQVILGPTEWQMLAVGFVVSFLVAWLVIALFMNFISRHNFKVFAYYRIALALLLFFLIAKGILG